MSLSRRHPWLALLVIASSACGSAQGTGGRASLSPCPDEPGFCAVFVTNDCTAVPCSPRPLAGLDAIELVRLDQGVADEDQPITAARQDGGVFFAPVPPGTYRVRPPGERFRGFLVTVADTPIVLDTRATETGGRLVGWVRIAVGGGADGNDAISDGGPGRYLVASILPLSGEAQVDRSAPRFAIADADGRFELALPPGRYYVSDIFEVVDTVRTYGPNMTPIAGQAVEIRAGDTTSIELTAQEMAP